MLLWLRRNDYRSAANCWKQMMKFQQRFADDEDILKAIAGAADLNQYDVIHLDIQWCLEPAGGAEQVVPYISERTIAELKEYYPDALSEDPRKTAVPEALQKIYPCYAAYPAVLC